MIHGGLVFAAVDGSGASSSGAADAGTHVAMRVTKTVAAADQARCIIMGALGQQKNNRANRRYFMKMQKSWKMNLLVHFGAL